MKFPLIKMAADPSLGKTWHDTFKQTPVAQFISSLSRTDDASRKAVLQPIYDSYVVYMTTLSDAAEKELAMKNIKELVTALSASPKAPQATPVAGVASPAAQPKKTDTKKSGPHAGMKLVQEKFNAFLKGVNFRTRVPVNGNQGDSTTWTVMKGVFPEWFEGGVRFKNYKQLADWLDARMTEVSSGSQEAQKAAPDVSEEYRQLVDAWRAFLQADSLNVGEDVVSAYAADTPRTVETSLQKYMAEKMKIPVQRGLEAALARILDGSPGEAAAALNQGAAAAKKYKVMKKLN